MHPVGLLWASDSDVAGPRWYVAPPDGHADVVCASRAGRVALYLVGPHEVASWKPTQGLDYTVTARLRAGALATLFSHPASDFTGRACALEDVWPAARELTERLAACASSRERGELLEAALAQRAFERQSSRDSAAEVQAALRALTASCSDPALPAEPLLTTIADQIGISERTLRRLFADGVGLSARTYRSLIRLDSALGRLRRTSAPCSAVAASCGYADQSHMNRDVRRFMGYSPEELRRRWIAEPPLLRPTLLAASGP